MSHILWHSKYPNVMVGVKCKGCDTIVRSWVEDETYEEIIKIGERTIVRKRMVMANLPLYAEVEFTLDDGSKFTTAGCRDCALNATPDDLQAWFEQDLDAMDDEDRRQGIASSNAQAFKARMRTSTVKDSKKEKDKRAG